VVSTFSGRTSTVERAERSRFSIELASVVAQQFVELFDDP
jgi:hypothetical protein